MARRWVTVGLEIPAVLRRLLRKVRIRERGRGRERKRRQKPRARDHGPGLRGKGPRARG